MTVVTEAIAQLMVNVIVPNTRGFEMRSWVRPLPCEGILCAVLGAALGVILALHGGLVPETWTAVPQSIGLLGIAVAFGLCIHFSSTAVLKGAPIVCGFFVFSCFAIGALFNYSRLEGLAIGSEGQVSFLPDRFALCVTAIFLTWLLVQIVVALSVVLFKGR